MVKNKSRPKNKLFVGNYHRSIEEKRRISIPYHFRRLLDSNVIYQVLTNEKKIRCYPEDSYFDRVDKYLKKPEDDPSRKAFFENIEKESIDGQGRIKLHSKAKFGLEKVIFSGNGDCFEITELLEQK